MIPTSKMFDRRFSSTSGIHRDVREDVVYKRKYFPQVPESFPARYGAHDTTRTSRLVTHDFPPTRAEVACTGGMFSHKSRRRKQSTF